METLRTNNSRIFRIPKAKFSRCCFYMNTNIQQDFQIYISVHLIKKCSCIQLSLQKLFLSLSLQLFNIYLKLRVVLCEKGVLRNIGLRPATLLKKRLWHRCFPTNFVKFLRTPFSQNTSGRLLLNVIFALTFTQGKINQTVVVTIKSMIYLI